MRSYPVNLHVQDRFCVVVGGGEVGTRKALRLMRCGARVTVISPATTPVLKSVIDSGDVRWLPRAFRSGDLIVQPDTASKPSPEGTEGLLPVPGAVFMVIAATDQAPVNAAVLAEARRTGILCSVADQPETGDFTLPAMVSRGDLIVTVSTSGKSPALARRLRKDLEAQLGEEYDVALRLLGALRRKLLREGHDPDAHKVQFRRVIDGGLISLIREERFREVDQLLMESLGEGYTFESLMKAALRP